MDDHYEIPAATLKRRLPIIDLLFSIQPLPDLSDTQLIEGGLATATPDNTSSNWPRPLSSTSNGDSYKKLQEAQAANPRHDCTRPAILAPAPRCVGVRSTTPQCGTPKPEWDPSDFENAIALQLIQDAEDNGEYDREPPKPHRTTGSVRQRPGLTPVVLYKPEPSADP